MTKIQKYITASSILAMMLAGGPVIGPAIAAGQSDEDIITLNQAIGKLDKKADMQNEAIVKILDWIGSMRAEIETLKAKVSASNPAPAPAPAEAIPAPAYPPAPPPQPQGNAEAKQPAVRPVVPAPVPAAQAAPKPPTPDEEVEAKAESKPADAKPVAPGQAPAAKQAEKVMKAGAVGRIAVSSKGQPDVDFGMTEISTAGEVRQNDLVKMTKLLPNLQRGQVVRYGFDGYLKVADAGVHSFILALDGGKVGRAQSCVPSVQIAGQEIAATDSKLYMPGRGGNERENQPTYAAAAELDGAGTLPISVRVACPGEAVPFKLLMKSPKDAAPAIAETLYRPAT